MLHKNKTLAYPGDKEKNGTSKANGTGMIILLTLIVSIADVTAQESFNATGGQASGNGGSASYSIGQVAYSTYTGTSGSVAQGVQQPYEISVLTAIESSYEINLSILAYPNPVKDYLALKIESENLKDVSYRLYDMNGKLLQSQKITGSLVQINMKELAVSTYFLKVMEGDKAVKTFKIIKKER